MDSLISISFPKSQINPSKPHKSPITPFLFLFLLLTTTTTAAAALRPSRNPKPKIPYAQYCNDVVPKPTLSSHSHNFSTSHSDFLPFRFGYFSGGGDRIFNRTGSDTPKSLSLSSLYSQKTASDGVFKVRASLYIRNPVVYSVSGRPKYRSLLRIRYRGPRVFGRFDDVVFSLKGYWSESTGKLCMVGSGSRYVDLKHFEVVLKLNYPKNSSIYGSLIGGTLESLNVKEGDSKSDYFEPIKILGLSQNPNYEYSLVEKLNGSDCLSGNGGRDSNTNNTNTNINLSLSKLDGGVCFVLNGRTSVYELEYGSDCGNVNCNPFGGSIGYLPDRIVYQGLRCEQRRKMQMLLGFPNSSYSGSGTQFHFDPNATLIAEGAWDDTENRFCGVACRILNVSESWSNAFVGDCSIGFTLRFPAVMSLRNQSSVVGEIWSKKDVNDSGYFGKIGFQSYWERSIDPQGLKYEYTEIESVRKFCAQGKTVRGKGKSYPDGYSPDMRFDMSVRNNDGKVAQGYSSPLFVGDSLYARQYYGRPLVLAVPRMTEPAAVHLTSNHSRMLNISYKMSFRPPPDFRFGGDASSKVLISAEGIYDRDTGFLCMIGCWHLQPNNQNLIKNGSLDCEIRINVQFPPFNAEHGEIVKGTIESTRAKSDPLYFESLQLSSNSITTTQAKESIWRMDLEITMVLISNTLACVFVGLQLFYVKKQPHVLPFISIVMLIVLTLGHMIPLLLNFEALFVANHNPTNFFLGSGGWLEVNEVIVRVITMVAFLLQLRLLQLTWSARKGDGSQKGWWDSDRKVLYVTLPIYIAGGFFAWFVHQWKNSYQRPLGSFQEPRLQGYHLHALQLLSYQQHSFWEDLKSYAGLLLNGFLLPQILFNLFFNSGLTVLHGTLIYHTFMQTIEWIFIPLHGTSSSLVVVCYLLCSCSCSNNLGAVAFFPRGLERALFTRNYL
ncbi:uncharacterized protein LOC126725970 isoform X2 [Quercus robur]|uniref:uncharacterized protein LOC126725970 isoform X2 n=1 Tax=Quercus robur TaxID=38942 RepID=UPI002161A7EC|nr:uncharacterized protein LOC126725970 isoform X2 [Quercus robur]